MGTDGKTCALVRMVGEFLQNRVCHVLIAAVCRGTAVGSCRLGHARVPRSPSRWHVCWSLPNKTDSLVADARRGCCRRFLHPLSGWDIPAYSRSDAALLAFQPQ
jgi:hypothetical protein